MRDYDLETIFLRRMLAHDQTLKSRQIEASITRTQRDHACAFRAVFTVGVIAIVSAMLSQATFFQSAPAIRLRIVCVIGLAATICLLVFLSVLVFYRLKLDGLREDSRRLIEEMIEARPARLEGPSRHTALSGEQMLPGFLASPRNGI